MEGKSGGEGRERGGEGKRREKERKGKGGKGPAPPIFRPRTAPASHVEKLL